MTDLGELSYFLGIKINQNLNDSYIFLSQSAYAEKILDKFRFSNLNSVRTHMEVNANFEPAKDSDSLCDPVLYQSLIGSLIYLSTKTRPDLSYAVNKLARFCSKPTSAHLAAVKRIFRYVKGTINYGLLYSKQQTESCIGYSDADWAGDKLDRKSTSGYSFQLSGASISWASIKQSCVALSTAEAEYIALAAAAQEASWLQNLLFDFNYQSNEPMVIYEDNIAAISIANDSQCTKKTKHIDLKYHYVRDCINEHKIQLKHCNSDDMLADTFTKSLSAVKFLQFRDMLGVTQHT